MRTLLIDNYDSYTYNLFQLVSVVNGEDPVVVHNDELDDGSLDLRPFDNVVISPGPGRPDRARDFGISATAVATTPVPLLGVCLGHQGIAAADGGEIAPAPNARHGYLTKVRHEGDGVFRGLPGTFTAVRYHSLCTSEPLPETLEATAWAEDGVVMGLRHRGRPLWGVQFHPESVATEYGAELLANFRDLTAEHQRAGGPSPARERTRLTGQPSGQAPRQTGSQAENRATAPDQAGAGPRYRLEHRVIDHETDAERVFTELYGTSPHAFWLDSARVEAGRARFSYLGDDHGPLAEYVRYDIEDDAAEVSTATGPPRREPGTVFDYLARQLAERTIDRDDCGRLPFDFTCGYAGYFGYELKGDLGSGNRHRAGTPDASWLFADRMVAIDHLDDRTYVLALTETDGTKADGTRRWLDETAARLQALGPPQPRARAGSRDPDDDTEDLLTRDRDQYLADITTIQDKLHAGESYEICLTNAAHAAATTGGYSFYRALRAGNPAPYGAYLRLDGIDVACSSPERFLSVDRDRWVETKPIKGTAPRGQTPEEDQQLRDSLTNSDKTRAENLMIVDLLRNDLGRVCAPGSVHVPRLMATETYATVHQLVSTIRGRLRDGASVVDTVRACFPGGSMTGAPKLRTMEIIDTLETEARGIYSGSIGFLSCNGTARLNIVIRTAVRVDGEWQVGAGGAIVLDSDPVEEYEEMLLKARATLRAPDRVAGQAAGPPGDAGDHTGEEDR
jgi:para-aminobenzoate synthetase